MDTSPYHMLLVVFFRTPCFPSLAIWCYLQPLHDHVFPISRNGGQNHMPSYSWSRQFLGWFSSAFSHELLLYLQLVGRLYLCFPFNNLSAYLVTMNSGGDVSTNPQLWSLWVLSTLLVSMLLAYSFPLHSLSLCLWSAEQFIPLSSIWECPNAIKAFLQLQCHPLT